MRGTECEQRGDSGSGRVGPAGPVPLSGVAPARPRLRRALSAVLKPRRGDRGPGATPRTGPACGSILPPAPAKLPATCRPVMELASSLRHPARCCLLIPHGYFGAAWHQPPARLGPGQVRSSSTAGKPRLCSHSCPAARLLWPMK